MAQFSTAIDRAYKSCMTALLPKYIQLESVNTSQLLSENGRMLKRQELHEEIEDIKERAYSEINSAYSSYAERVERNFSAISGKDIDNSDFKLLKEDLVKLTQKEFEVICSRYKSNYLMMKALDEYTNSHSTLHMPYAYATKEEKLFKAEDARRFFCDNVRSCIPVHSGSDRKISELKSYDYETYIAMNGIAELDEICCE